MKFDIQVDDRTITQSTLLHDEIPGMLYYADNSVNLFPIVNLHEAMKRLVNIN